MSCVSWIVAHFNQKLTPQPVVSLEVCFLLHSLLPKNRLDVGAQSVIYNFKNIAQIQINTYMYYKILINYIIILHQVYSKEEEI